MFFTLVEGQIRLVNHLSGVLSPFGASSDAGMLLTMPPNHPALSEAVAQWLSAHHVCILVNLCCFFSTSNRVKVLTSHLTMVIAFAKHRWLALPSQIFIMREC